MFYVTKKFKFCGAHYVPTLEEGNPCKTMHGHNYTVEITFKSDELDKHGFVIDVKSLGIVKKYIDTFLDHKVLNDALGFTPTSERLAEHFFNFCHGHWPDLIHSVRLQETDTIWATYQP